MELQTLYARATRSLVINCHIRRRNNLHLSLLLLPLRLTTSSFHSLIISMASRIRLVIHFCVGTEWSRWLLLNFWTMIIRWIIHMNISHIVYHWVLFGSRSWSHAHILSVLLLKYIAIVAVFMIWSLSTIYFLLLSSSSLDTWIAISPCIIILFVYVSTDHLALALPSTNDIQLPFHLCNLIVWVTKLHNFLIVVRVIKVLNWRLGITNVQTIVELVWVMVSFAWDFLFFA